MTIVFGIVLLLGLLYLLLMIFGGLGDALDIDIEGVLDGTGLDAIFGLDALDAGSDASGIGCSVIAAFMAGFGAVGLTGSLSEWNIPATIAAAIVFGWLLSRAAGKLLTFVFSQQSESITFSAQDLIGMSARVTINSAAGKTGQVMVEGAEIRKYAVQEINDAELRRGDIVEIVDVSGRFLRVKKKRG